MSRAAAWWAAAWVALAWVGCGSAVTGAPGAGSGEGADAGSGDAAIAEDVDADGAEGSTDGAHGADSDDAREVDGGTAGDADPDADDADADVVDEDADVPDARGDTGRADAGAGDAHDAAMDAPGEDVGTGADAAGCERVRTELGADLPRDGTAVAGDVSPCARAAHAMVAPAGSRWRVEVTGLPRGAGGTVRVELGTFFAGARPGAVAEPSAAVAGIARLDFDAPRSGEFAVVLDDLRTTTTSTYRVSASCLDGCEREATRFPVVLVHGYAGVDSYFGVLDYFYAVRPLLEGLGYSVAVPTTSPIATSERRAQQLAEQLGPALEALQARKVNVIAHSQGGLDARELVSTLGWADRVASITTVATPHGGIPLRLADFLSVQDFSPEAAAEFDARNPDAPGVRYWSWTARTCGALDFGCQERSGGESVDAFLVASHVLLSRFGENDGIVPTASMARGEVLGLLFADHFDEVGQIADGSPEGDPFDHRAFYLGEARRLRDAGL